MARRSTWSIRRFWGTCAAAERVGGWPNLVGFPASASVSSASPVAAPAAGHRSTSSIRREAAWRLGLRSVSWRNRGGPALREIGFVSRIFWSGFKSRGCTPGFSAPQARRCASAVRYSVIAGLAPAIHAPPGRARGRRWKEKDIRARVEGWRRRLAQCLSGCATAMGMTATCPAAPRASRLATPHVFEILDFPSGSSRENHEHGANKLSPRRIK